MNHPAFRSVACFSVCCLLLSRADIPAASSGDADVLFADAFGSPELAPEWIVESGKWGIEDGALTAPGRAVILLDKVPGSRFELEMEVSYEGDFRIFLDQDKSTCFRFYSYHHSNRSPDHGAMYVWELDPDTSDVLQSKTYTEDSDFGPGVFQRVRLIYDCGNVEFYVGDQLKEKVTFRVNPDPRIVLGSWSDNPGTHVKVRDLTIRGLTGEPEVVAEIGEANLLAARLHAADGLAVKPVNGGKLEIAKGQAGLAYDFSGAADFDLRFVRLPVDVARSGRIWLDVESDGSGNTFFLTVVDATGEHHVVAEIPMRWEGSRRIGINLAPFFELRKERTRKHWGGDENQKIDFPIAAIDVGVARRGAATAESGKLKFGSLRFAE